MVNGPLGDGQPRGDNRKDRPDGQRPLLPAVHEGRGAQIGGERVGVSLVSHSVCP